MPGNVLWSSRQLSQLLLGVLFAAPAEAINAQWPAAPELRASDEMRIDGMRENLAPLDWIAVRSDGVIAVHQNFDRTVRFYGPDGVLRNTFGREGDGPGEFRRISSAGWRGDTLWLSEAQRNRVTFVSPQYSLVRTALAGSVRPPVADAARYFSLRGQTVRAMYADGSALIEVTFPFLRNAASDAPTPLQFAHVSHDGELLRPPVIIQTPNIRLEGFLIPFTEPSVASVSPNGERIVSVVTQLRGSSGILQVKAHTGTGQLISSREISFAAVRISRGSLDSAYSNEVKDCTARRFLTNGCRAFSARGRASMPEFHSPVDEVIAGTDGSTWLRLRQTPQGRPWLILDSNGEIVGRVNLAANVRPLVIEQSRAWVAQTDSLGVQSVVRLAIGR